jgi:hypothetical protein
MFGPQYVVYEPSVLSKQMHPQAKKYKTCYPREQARKQASKGKDVRCPKASNKKQKQSKKQASKTKNKKGSKSNSQIHITVHLD